MFHNSPLKDLRFTLQGRFGRGGGGFRRAGAPKGEDTTDASGSQLSRWEAGAAHSTNTATISQCKSNYTFWAGSAVHSPVAAGPHGRIMDCGRISKYQAHMTGAAVRAQDWE